MSAAGASVADAPLASDNDNPAAPSNGTAHARRFGLEACFPWDMLESSHTFGQIAWRYRTLVPKDRTSIKLPPLSLHGFRNQSGIACSAATRALKDRAKPPPGDGDIPWMGLICSAPALAFLPREGPRKTWLPLQRLAKGAPTEADAPRVDKEGPATTYLLVTVLPRAVTGSPRGTGEVPCCASGASPCARESSDKKAALTLRSRKGS